MNERARMRDPLPDEGADRPESLRPEFLDRVAHELRGPAGVTLGALDEIELALGDAAEQSRPFLAMARRGAYRVLRTADRLSRSAQLEAGVQYRFAATDLRQLLRQASVEALRLEERANLRLEVVLPDAPSMVSVDAGWVQAALTELISHAMRRAKSMVSAQITNEHVFIITDDGPLFKTSLHAQGFEPGADRRDASPALPFARDVAHAHGGTFVIDSSAEGMHVKVSFGGAQ